MVDEKMVRGVADVVEAAADALLTAAGAFLMVEAHEVTPDLARAVAVGALDVVLKRTETEGAKPRA
jgi:hypothetical protein